MDDFDLEYEYFLSNPYYWSNPDDRQLPAIIQGDQFPVQPYVNPEAAAENYFVPAVWQPPVFAVSGVPPKTAANFALLSKGLAPFIIMPVGTYEKERITQAMHFLLHNLSLPMAWEGVWVAIGGIPGHGGANGTAELYVVDRRNERYQVIDVDLDYGGETGRLVLRHIGRRSRERIEIDIEHAFSYMLPIVMYKKTF